MTELRFARTRFREWAEDIPFEGTGQVTRGGLTTSLGWKADPLVSGWSPRSSPSPPAVSAGRLPNHCSWNTRLPASAVPHTALPPSPSPV